MSTEAIDEVLSRWFRDGNFRKQLRRDPERALVNYDLTPDQREWFFNLKERAAEDESDTAVLSESETAASVKPALSMSKGSVQAVTNHPFSLN